MTIDKKAEELAREFNEAGHLKYDADEKPLAELIASALRAERQEAAGRAAHWYEFDDPSMTNVRLKMPETLATLRAAILKED